MSGGGLLIEPVVELSDKLKKKYYKYPNIRVIGKAVSDYNGIGKFYKLNTKALKLYSTPDFANELGSLNKSNLLKCFGGTLRNYVDELNIELRTLNSIIEENKDLFTRGIDLIHIDAVGHDFKIIKNLNFDKYAPAAILLEHKNLDTNDKQQLNSFLTSKQYKISMYKYDLLAVRMG